MEAAVFTYMHTVAKLRKVRILVTGPAKTGHICIKYTHLQSNANFLTFRK